MIIDYLIDGFIQLIRILFTVFMGCVIVCAVAIMAVLICIIVKRIREYNRK